MTSETPTHWIAFGAGKLVALGPPRQVAEHLLAFLAQHPDATPQVFDAESSQPVELDLRGSRDAVLRRVPREPRAALGEAPPVAAPTDAARGPGRPRLGVVAREVTLLPRHWEWLTAQPGGASVALRKLVEQALRSSRESDRARLATESAYRFMHAMAGNAPGFEEATRALFAHDHAKVRTLMARWPADVRAHATQLVDRIGSAPAAAEGDLADAAGSNTASARQRTEREAT